VALVASVKEAEKWLKAATDDIRNERLAPLARQARSIWGMLRQESNVDLGAIRLAGSSTSRHVELDVSVDGAAGSALGVMSQGEVNALALSVFLPRARLPASPFRFLVIDDPVQAMDPAKVDGLARVLEKAAADRQVIVFTHDNRLAQAVRQLKLPACVLEVTRRPGSVVEVRPCLDPVEQALRDAGALAADKSVPSDVAAWVVPGLCRTAVEAAFTEAVWRQQLRAGRGHTEIEADLEGAVRLNLLAALALTGDAGQGAAVLPRLNAWGRQFAGTYQALDKGSHLAYAGVWPRAAALLARQALELAMAALWAARPQAAGLAGCSMRSQLLCLTAYLDQHTATRTAYLSAALSRACQHHSYELAPTAAELARWLTEAADLVTLMQAPAQA
jgi:hypothetical protein